MSPVIGVRMPAVARWAGVAGTRGKRAGATAPATLGALAVLLGLGGAVPVTGVDAPEPEPDEVVPDGALALDDGVDPPDADPADVEPAGVDSADVGCWVAGALAEAAGRVGDTDAVAAGAADAGAAAVSAGAAAEPVAVVPLAAVLAALVSAAPVSAVRVDGAAAADAWLSLASVG
jgi:hypothetical protein